MDKDKITDHKKMVLNIENVDQHWDALFANWEDMSADDILKNADVVRAPESPCAKERYCDFISVPIDPDDPNDPQELFLALMLNKQSDKKPKSMIGIGNIYHKIKGVEV